MSWSHKLRYALLDWQAERLLRKINRPYKQSQHQLNPAQERGITRQEVVCGLAIVAALLVTLWIEST